MDIDGAGVGHGVIAPHLVQQLVSGDGRAAVFDHVPSGTRDVIVEATDDNNLDWVQIIWNGKSGWVMTRGLTYAMGLAVRLTCRGPDWTVELG